MIAVSLVIGLSIGSFSAQLVSDIYLNGEAMLSITLIALLLGIISVSIGIIYK